MALVKIGGIFKYMRSKQEFLELAADAVTNTRKLSAFLGELAFQLDRIQYNQQLAQDARLQLYKELQALRLDTLTGNKP